MLGIVVDPNFKKKEEFMLLQLQLSTMVLVVKTTDVCNGNIIMRFEVSKDMKSVSNRTDIVNDIQYKPFESDHPFGGPGAHNGNRLRFGPEGYLWAYWYVTKAYHNTNLGGNVLRIDTDGKAHPGNKPPKGFDKRMYTYGHRNVQGIDFRPSDGRAFTAERSMA